MALLNTRELVAFYQDFQALYGVTFELEAGETVAIIGANGAGKSTFLKAIAGLVAVRRSAIQFKGCDIGSTPPAQIVNLGIAMVPEGRRLFPSLSLQENLLVGAWRGKDGYWGLETVYRLFPRLRERRYAPSTALSGGEQQMVAIGRALMSNPRLLLCDEISLGLAPIVVRDIYGALPTIRAEGTSLVIVEQDISQAMAVADRVYCFQEGRVTLSGRPTDFTPETIHEAYFGLRS
jgi:branched-chain amino acid transport system ATP-binding protein